MTQSNSLAIISKINQADTLQYLGKLSFHLQRVKKDQKDQKTPKKDQKYPMLRENFNQTSKRRNVFGNLVVPSRRPFSEKSLLKIRQLYHREAPFLYHRTAPCRTECSRIPKKIFDPPESNELIFEVWSTISLRCSFGFKSPITLGSFRGTS